MHALLKVCSLLSLWECEKYRKLLENIFDTRKFSDYLCGPVCNLGSHFVRGKVRSRKRVQTFLKNGLQACVYKKFVPFFSDFYLLTRCGMLSAGLLSWSKSQICPKLLSRWPESPIQCQNVMPGSGNCSPNFSQDLDNPTSWFRSWNFDIWLSRISRFLVLDQFAGLWKQNFFLN